MPAPSNLKIKTLAVERLVKEYKSYQKELESQEARFAKVEAEVRAGASKEGEEGNAEFALNQEQRAILETKKIMPTVQSKLDDALKRLEEEIASTESADAGAEEVARAKEVFAAAPGAGS